MPDGPAAWEQALYIHTMSHVRDLGIEVVRVCRNGEEALRDYPLVRPDIVTMDITMPGMNGIDTMIGILAVNPQARVIMVTSHGQEAMVVRAIDSGAVGYVLKPVSKDRLAQMIERAMAHVPAARNRAFV